MNVNHMSKIAEMLGVELNEEFKVLVGGSDPANIR